MCGARYPFVLVSARGLCPAHQKIRREDNMTDLVEHKGPYFEHWRQRSLAALGILPPVDEPAENE